MMRPKEKKRTESDLDKALAKVGSAAPKKLKSDEPLSENDEEKQVEEKQAEENIKKNKI